jgi:hypothetical protein
MAGMGRESASMHSKSIQSICEFNGLEPVVPDGLSKLGIALGTLGLTLINGLRLPFDGETCGWYLWCGGEPTKAEDFYSPLHVQHIDKYLPQARKYLALPPGYRFLIDDKGYQDVWFDGSLLD